MLYDFQDLVIKGHDAPSLFSEKLTFGDSRSHSKPSSYKKTMLEKPGIGVPYQLGPASQPSLTR